MLKISYTSIKELININNKQGKKMKKLIIVTLAFMLGSFSMASAELGVNVGFSGQMGAFVANGTENEDTEQHRGSAASIVGYGSVFVEKTLGSRLSVGVDYVPYALESETAQELRTDQVGALATNVAVTNKIQVDFEDLTTLYAMLNLNENFYIKAGVVSVDVLTNESLGTGSSYGNTSLDGNMYGAGYNQKFDSGLFLRAEGNVMMFDGASLTSTADCATRVGTCANNVIKLEELNGVSGKISIGKSF